QAALVEALALPAGDAHRVAQRDGQGGDALGVAVRVGALRLDGPRQGEDDGLGAVALLDQALDAQQRAAAGDGLDEVEGFVEELVGPVAPGGDLADERAAGDDDDGDQLCAGVVLEPPTDLVAGHAGQIDVEQDQVGPLAAGTLQPLGAITAQTDG